MRGNREPMRTFRYKNHLRMLLAIRSQQSLPSEIQVLA